MTHSSGVTRVGYEMLKLENQLCFPLYACAKEVVKKYKPYLDEIDLTYTQYIAMMVLWENESVNVKTLGDKLFLDSGTLTPMLKKMEQSGLIARTRDGADERNVVITLTDKGDKLKDSAADIPRKVGGCINLSREESLTLYTLLYKILSI